MKKNILAYYTKLIARNIIVLIILWATQRVWEPYLISYIITPVIQPIFEQNPIGIYVALITILILLTVVFWNKL
jgi:hypothetical protein